MVPSFYTFSVSILQCYYQLYKYTVFPSGILVLLEDCGLNLFSYPLFGFLDSYIYIDTSQFLSQQLYLPPRPPTPGLYPRDLRHPQGPNCLSYDNLIAVCSWFWFLVSRSSSSLQNANEIINGNDTLSIFQGCCDGEMSSFMSNTLKNMKFTELVGIKQRCWGVRRAKQLFPKTGRRKFPRRWRNWDGYDRRHSGSILTRYRGATSAEVLKIFFKCNSSTSLMWTSVQTPRLASSSCLSSLKD